MERQISLFCLEEARETTNPVSCCKCGNICSSVNDLETHISVEHLNFSPYECVFCPIELPIRLATEHNLRRHVKLFHPDRDCKILFKADNEYSQKKSKLLCLLKQSLMSNVGSEEFAAATSSPAATPRLQMELPNPKDLLSPPPQIFVAMKSSSSLNLSMESDMGDSEERPRTLFEALPVLSTPLLLTEQNQMDDANTLVASLFHPPMDHLSTPTTTGDRLTCAVCEEEMGKKDVVIHVRKHMPREANRDGRSDSFFTMRPDYIAHHNMCFPGLLRKKLLTCLMCRAIVPNDYSSKRVHIFRRHLKIPVYQCTLCKTGFNKVTRKRLTHHFSSHHKDAEPEAINNFKQHEAQFGELMRRCFQRTGMARPRRHSSVSLGSVEESPVESVVVAGLRRNSTDLDADVENSSTAPILTPSKRVHCTLCNTSCPTSKKREHVLKCHVRKPVMFCPYPGCDWKSLFVNYTGYYHHRSSHRGFGEAARNESHKFNDQIDQFFSVCFGSKKRGSRNLSGVLRQCSECHMQLHSESEIDEHPWIHVNEPLFECSVCIYHSRSPTGLPDVKAHIQTEHQGGGRLPPPPAEDLRDMHRQKYEHWRRKCFDVDAKPPSTSAAASGADLSSKPSQEIELLLCLD